MIARRPPDRAVPATHVEATVRFERLFRAAANLDVDKESQALRRIRQSQDL
jgi:hypothetical protein